MTVLVDTSVWIAHFRCADRRLADLLDRGAVATHPFVVGELACGNLRARAEILGLLAALPTAPAAAHDEALRCLEAWDLAGTGLGWIDVHL
ncbi:MAG: VapC toxin family PIN domain ribonuclease, partial [Candidatus Krumholzibacteriia bacterium]